MKASVDASSNCSMCTARELMQVNITAYLFSSFLLFLNCERPKAIHSTVCKERSRFHSIFREICHLLAFCWSSLSSALYAFINVRGCCIHIPQERISFIVIPFLWCLTLSRKWSMISSVTWEHLGSIIGCLTANGKVEFSSLPPTLISPWSSMKGSNLNKWLCVVSLGFYSLWLRLAISFLNAERWSSLKIRISASCRSATVVVTVFGLFFLKGLLRYEITPTALVQLENLDT